VSDRVAQRLKKKLALNQIQQRVWGISTSLTQTKSAPLYYLDIGRQDPSR